jgi:NADH-quinone oxidoreductase subunit J
MTLTFELVVFFLLAAVAIGAALGMLLSSNAVHSALFLVANFAVVAVFFVLLNAPFIAMVQVTVYAGAIMVLFLFVIMLLGAEMLRRRSTVLRWQPAVAAVLAVVFVAALGGLVVALAGSARPPAAFSADQAQAFGGPVDLGLALFQQYLLPFELTSFLLLVAMIGAVVLTRDAARPERAVPAAEQPSALPQAASAAVAERASLSPAAAHPAAPEPGAYPPAGVAR